MHAREDLIAPPPSKGGGLADHPLWSMCRPATVELLLDSSTQRPFSPRDIIFEEGTGADCLHVVLTGAVELFSRYRRLETEFGVVEPPRSFVMAAVVMDRLHLTSARAFEPSEILMIPAVAVRRAFESDEIFARSAALEMAHSYRAITRELKSQTLLTSIERLAKWLVERDSATGNRHVVRVPYEKRGLAARLGMVPEVFSRSLAALAKKEIGVRGAVIEIRDPEALSRMAEPQPPLFCPGD